MKISNTFAIVPGSLFTAVFEGVGRSEFRNMFNYWDDPEWLEQFFETHKADLQSGFWGNISVEDAVLRTRQEAKEVKYELLHTASFGKTDKKRTLSLLFKPLHNETTRLDDYEKSKHSGINKPGWLRIYAIRIAPNLFLITGGAIKLTEAMNQRAHLLLELEKLEVARQYLLNSGDDDHNFELFELF